MKTNYTTQFIKIGTIAGMLYSSGLKTDTIVIYGIGAPILPDNGSLPDAPIIMQYPVDLFVPDYIGYGRSDGTFTPMNCIRTFLRLYQAFTNGCEGKNSYRKVSQYLQYKRVIFIGRSFGGTYVPLLPHFNPDILELAIFCPVVDSKSCGSIAGEESNADFLDSMRDDGYHHLYRGILASKWEKHLDNQDDLSPMDNVQYLKQAKLFIGHGRHDECVNYSKSQAYYQLLKKTFPNTSQNYTLKLYPEGDHGPSTTNKAADDFMKWLGLEKVYECPDILEMK